MDDPTPLGQYLGCNHVQGTVTLPNGNTAKTVSYDMEEFLSSCVARYIDLATAITGVAQDAGGRNTIYRGLSRWQSCRESLRTGRYTECVLPMVQ